MPDPEREREAPEDKGNVVYIIFFLQGVGMMFPWNTFINAAGYYQGRFCGSQWEKNFAQIYSTLFTAANVGAMFLSILYQKRVPLKLRALVPLTLSTFVFSVITATVFLDMHQDLLFYVTLGCVFLSGIGTAFLQGGIFGLAGQMPDKYTQAVMGGQGLAGMMVSAVYYITVLASDNTSDPCSNNAPNPFHVDWSSAAYFFVTVTVLLLSMLSYLLLIIHPLVKYWQQVVIEETSGPAWDNTPSATPVQTPVKSIKVGPGYHRIPNLEDDVGDTVSINRSSSIDVDPENQNQTDKTQLETPLLDPSALPSSPPMFVRSSSMPMSDEGRVTQSFRTIKYMALAVFLVFYVTLSVFPSVVQNLKSYNGDKGRFFASLFVPLFFFLFNLGDFIGRMAAGGPDYIATPNLWRWVVARFVFIPAFLYCNLGPDTVLTPYFTHDAWPISFMIVFAISNGYLASKLMMKAPAMVKPEWMETAGTMMAFFLTTGLLCGSAMSFAFLPLL